MSDSTKQLIQSLIDKIAQEEKERVLSSFEEMRKRGSARTEMLIPLKSILSDIQKSIATYKDISINIGSDLNLYTHSPSGGDSYEITANPDNSTYIVHEQHFFEGTVDKRSYSYETLNDLIAFIIEVIGKQVGKEDACSTWVSGR